ncbi:MAG: hypothetical protein AAF065_12065 [Verrucomicrobiota bacterium]
MKLKNRTTRGLVILIGAFILLVSHDGYTGEGGLLSPQIQEQLLNLPETSKGREELGLTKLIPLTRIHSWSKQETAFTELLRDLK